MKSKIIHLVSMAFTVGVICLSCNQQERKTADLQRINDSMEHPHNYVDTLNADRQDWEKFKMEAQAKIKQNQDSIDAFVLRMSKSESKAKDKYKEKIALLQELNVQLKKRVDEYKEEGRDKWTHFEHDFNNDMDTLGQRMKEVFAVEHKP